MESTLMSARFTYTEQRIMDLLSDGLPHKRKELLTLLPDDLGDRTNVNIHLFRIRQKLPKSQAIVCELMNRSIAYRHVRLITPPQE